MRVNLPAGLGVLDPVVLPADATVGAQFHRPSGCGLDRVGRTETAALAFGLGCRPCPDCWPDPAADSPAQAVLSWPSGYRSRLGVAWAAPADPPRLGVTTPPAPGTRVGLAGLISENAIDTVELPRAGRHRRGRQR
ncbi:hypothetical protein E1211_30525 [Micromonospora sp. 15K316]|uniref:hypothetical protein n=1 Tax=Micromonospora sp. 15K316 TaxID=2530376 RepID=UPI00104BDDC9|nr:hypothetical protein [Micromonospora sp. 15K316]TDC25943.1 hypothetical protein E1211_30525 [Micromonospora sp. 15K316]